MTTKVLTGTYTSGYPLHAPITTLSIASTGYVEGSGVATSASATSTYTIVNIGRVVAANVVADPAGIYLSHGGVVTNGSNTDTAAQVRGWRGVEINNAAGTIGNFGTIIGYSRLGVWLNDGGLITNGSTTDTSALINAVNDPGISINGPGTVNNFGTISGIDAMQFINDSGGVVINGGVTDTTAEILGAASDGIIFYNTPGTVTNFGTIRGANLATVSGVYIGVGGTLTNGSVNDTSALIVGYTGVETAGGSPIVNFSSIHGEGAVAGSFGVYLLGGGSLSNGGSTDLGAEVSGYVGVYAKAATATVTNFGTISAPLGAGVDTKNDGVQLTAGGSVTNGAAGAGATALIEGSGGVVVAGAAGSVANFGTIEGPHSAGVYLGAGGSVTNGAGNDVTATIEGYGGVVAAGSAASIINYGTIVVHGRAGAAIALYAGGSVQNGTTLVTGALTQGYAGIFMQGGAGSVTNLGTVLGTAGDGWGVLLDAGGSVTNGAPSSDTSAEIEGNTGAIVSGGDGSVINFGTIQGTGVASGAGVYLGARDSLTNGSAADVGATVQGFIGVTVAAGSAGPVTNFGTIKGTGGVAVQFGASSDVLVVEAKSSFVGLILGDGGTLDLASGVGTLTGLLVGGNVTVSGSMTTTTFSNFGTVEIGAGAKFTTSGAVTIASGQAVIDGGTLTVSGSVANAGTISLPTTAAAASLILGANTTLSGGGTISLGSGQLNRLEGTSASTVLVNVDNTITGAGLLGVQRLTLTNQAKGVIEASVGTIALQTNGETVVNTGLMEAVGGGHLNIQATVVNSSGGGVLSAADGSTVNLRNATLIGGTLTSAGSGDFATFFVDNVIDGTTSAVTNESTVKVADGTQLTMQGQVINSDRILVSAVTSRTHLTVGAAGLTLTGAGTVTLSNNADNFVSGATATATLTNVDNTIAGAGQLGDGKLTLNNEAKGVIDASGSTALLINTGTATLANAGLIEAVGSGGATVFSAINSTGTLEAAGGTLTIDKAVTGTGSAVITGGTLDLLSTFSQAVSFTGKSGVLELARSQSYTGSITGFSKTGGTSLDLGDIAFKSSGEATFSGTTTSGVLTVTDGAHTARITLIGDYIGSTFTASSDGHGGTNVIDPTAPGSPAAAQPSPHRFIAAMAGMGASQVAAIHTGEAGTIHEITLLRPRVMTA